MNKITLSIFALLLNLISFGSDQETLIQLLNKVKERTLLVEIPSKDTKYIERLTAKGETDILNEYLTHYNDFVLNYKKAFSEHWTLNKEISFKTYDEIQQIIESKSYNYAIIKHFSKTEIVKGLDKIKPDDNIYTFSHHDAISKFSERKFTSRVTMIALYLSDQPGYILKCRLPFKESLAGFVYTIKQFDFTYEVVSSHPERDAKDIYGHNYYEAEKRIKKLKSYTLYIKEEDLEKKIDMDKVSKIYKYKYKIVSNEEWEQAIINKKPEIACAIIVPATANALDFYHIVFTAEDGKMLINCNYNFGISEESFKAYYIYTERMK